MKYCKKCKHMYDDSIACCDKCQKVNVELTDKNTPVFLCSATGMNRELISEALSQSNIPCSEQRRKKSISAEAITGGDLSEVDILVPYQAYNKARNICIGIGIIDSDKAEILSDEEAIKIGLTPEEEKEQQSIEEFGEMGRTKRTVVRIVSAFLLILIACGVIFGTDAIMNFIKGMF